MLRRGCVGDEALASLGAKGFVLGGDGVHVATDGVEAEAEVCGGVSEGSALEDAGDGDALAGWAPCCWVVGDEDKAG